MARKTEDQIFRARQAREGKKGGIKTRDTQSAGFYSRIAKEGWEKRKKKNDK